MNTKEVEIQATMHPAQAEIHRSQARFRVLAAGRRFGKTRLGVFECFDVASQGGRSWWVSPSYKMSNVGWRPIRRLAAQIPGAEVRKVDRQVILPGGGEISVRSADNPDSLRGEGLDKVVLDECSFMQEIAWTEALRPSLSDRGGRAMFISTPKGRNWFWRMWMRGDDKQDGDFQSWIFPTGANPFIPSEEIEAARRSLPERVFQQEYLAEFVDDAGGIFRRVMDAATSEEHYTPEDGKQYIAAVDVATMVDFTVASVMDVGAKAQVYLDRFNRVDYGILEDRLEALYRRFKMDAMTIEANSIGQPVIDALVSRGMNIIPFTTTNATKQAAIQGLQAAFEHGDIKILPDPVQIGELQAYQGERSPNGSWKYGAPQGLHDDTVMALAMAWQGLDTGAVILFGA